MDTTQVRLDDMRSAPVYANDGDKIGAVEEIFYDTETQRPEWVGMGTGFLGTKRVLVPVEGASMRDDGLSVAYTKDRVKDAPDIDDDQISRETEQQLYEYYGLESGGTTPSDDVEQSTNGESVTRSEEELRVGKQRVEAPAACGSASGSR